MKNKAEILELEEKYKKLLMEKFSDDKRVELDYVGKYPEPAFVYIKPVKSDKSIAVRLDGEDGTLRFWDYVDDNYAGEDGLWDSMTEKGINNFVAKLKATMEHAYDIEYFLSNGDCDDYHSGLYANEIDEVVACKLTKKYGKEIRFTYAKFTTFFGEKHYVFDKLFRLIKR